MKSRLLIGCVFFGHVLSLDLEMKFSGNIINQKVVMLSPLKCQKWCIENDDCVAWTTSFCTETVWEKNGINGNDIIKTKMDDSMNYFQDLEMNQHEKNEKDMKNMKIGMCFLFSKVNGKEKDLCCISQDEVIMETKKKTQDNIDKVQDEIDKVQDDIDKVQNEIGNENEADKILTNLDQWKNETVLQVKDTTTLFWYINCTLHKIPSERIFQQYTQQASTLYQAVIVVSDLQGSTIYLSFQSMNLTSCIDLPHGRPLLDRTPPIKHSIVPGIIALDG